MQEGVFWELHSAVKVCSLFIAYYNVQLRLLKNEAYSSNHLEFVPLVNISRASAAAPPHRFLSMRSEGLSP